MQSIFLSHFFKFLHYPFNNEKEKLGNMKMEPKKKRKIKRTFDAITLFSDIVGHVIL